jgi:C-terminal processing protease CtpA/Prc
MIYNWSEWNSINENFTQEQMSSVEEYADKLFGELGLDVEFSRHFRDRLNDPRNEKPISAAELIGLFKRAYQRSGKKIAEMPPNAEAVLRDMRTDINTPFVIEYDRKNGGLDLVLKTIMRKKNFMSTNEIIPI